MKDNIVSVRLENKDYDLLQQVAQLRGESLSDVIRAAIRQNIHTSNVPVVTTSPTPSYLTLLVS